MKSVFTYLLSSWFMVLGTLAGCDGSAPEDEATEALEVTLPPSAPVCEKNAAQLLVFTDYQAANCSGDDCLPSCGAGSPPCPGGSQCDNTIGRCKPIECSANPDLCTGQTICNEVIVDGTTMNFCGLPPDCASDDNCPCGSYCNAQTQRCSLDCLVTASTGGHGLGCNGTLQCDTRGHCSNPAGIPVPPEVVTIVPGQAVLQVPRAADGRFTAVSLTVQITTPSANLGTRPGPAPAVNVITPSSVSVTCATGQQPTAGGCAISGWTFQLQGTLYVASRTLQVKVADGNTDPQWDINLTSAGVPQPVVVPAFPRAPQPQRGRYVGSLVLEPSGIAIPIQATVTDIAIELHDPSHVVGPTGTVLLRTDGTAASTSFIAGREVPHLYNTNIAQFSLVLPAPVIDPGSGQLAGALRVSVATSGPTLRTWSFTLTRTADLVTTEPCPVGESFDAAVSACIPTAPWDAAVPAAPSFVDAKVTAWLHAMAPRIRDTQLVADGAEALAERLLCFDSTLPPSNTNRFLNQTKSGGLTGDLQCTNPNTPHAWWGVGLVSYADRVTASTQIAQFDMLAQCMQQLMKDAPGSVAPGTIDNSSCVSLARFYPALFSVAGTAPYRFDPLLGGAQHDQRSRLLFMRLLQQWSQLAGFIARNGTQQRGVADLLTQLSPRPEEQPLLNATPNSVTYEALLTAVERAWTLLLDKRIQQPLIAIPGRAIASPDYRQLKKPLTYWTFSRGDRSTGSVANIGLGPPLAASGCTYFDNGVHGSAVGSTSCTHQAALPGIDRNLTVGLLAGPNSTTNTTSTLIDSDGLIVKHVRDGTGARLQVGHRISGGATELVSFPVRLAPNSVFVVRDARAKVYKFYDSSSDMPNGYVGETVIRQASYTNPPQTASDTMFVGASRTSSASNLKGRLSHVAIWDSALSPSEMGELFTLYNRVSFAAHAVWPTEVALPPGNDQNAHEAAVGLPVSLLEGLIATTGLIEAYIKDAALGNPAACRRGNVDDVLARASERAARSLREGYAIQLLAENLYGQATALGPVAWKERYDLALAELQAARNSVIKVLGNAHACQHPMGLGPQEFPLYFSDSRSLVTGNPPPPLLNVVEASALFLMGKARDVNQQASTALDEARRAWVDRYSSEVQEIIADQSAEQRLDDIRANFGRELIDACGIPVDTNGQTEITVLNRFLSRELTSENCFVVESLECAATPNLPLNQTRMSCLRGQIGESLIATESARQRVQRATIGWNSARGSRDAWFEHCAAKQDFQNETKEMIDAVADDLILENELAKSFGLFSGAMQVLGGAATKNPAMAVGGMSTMMQAVDQMSSKVTERRIREQAMLQKRQLDETMLDCWHQADLAKIPVDGAAQDIVVASSDLQASLAHVETQQQHVAALVAEASAAIARENGRVRPRIAFHYWSDEKLALYQRSLERARRMTYLALRAVEHDLQRNFGLDRDVLVATHPAQLQQIVDVRLAGELANGMELLPFTQHFVVLNMCKDVLRLPEIFGEPDCDTGVRSAQRFREILLSPANAHYDETGTYAGQVLAFTLDPALSGIEQRCAEHLAQVNAHYVADAIDPPLRVVIAKRESFYSKTCGSHIVDVGGPTQVGTLRSSNNLLLDGTVPQFGQDRIWTPAQVDALKSGNDGFETDNTPGPNNAPDLAGRGIYGDYRLIVLPSAVNAITSQTGDLRELKIRLDYVSVPDTAPTPAGASTLATEMRDGNDLVISSPNSVSAVCPGGAPTCQRDSIAQLTASPAAGWHFGGWGGACAGSSASCRIAMGGPRKAFATFINDAPGVAVSAARSGTGGGGVAGGWVGVTAGSEAGGANLPWTLALPANTPLTLFASPALDSVFSGWSGACSGTGDCSVTASSARSVTAAFTVKPQLTVRIATDTLGLAFDGNDFLVNANGTATSMICQRSTHCPSGSAAGCVAVCIKRFNPGETVSFTHSLTGPFAFMGWANDCSGSSCSVTMSTNRTVTANFKIFNALSVVTPGHGGITSSGVSPAINCGNGQTQCSAEYPPNTSVRLTAVPALGFRLENWTLAGASCGSTATCTVPFSGRTTQISASFSLSGACVPGDTEACCSCGTPCCENGQRTCNSNGQWGSCVGSLCRPPNGECQ